MGPVLFFSQSALKTCVSNQFIKQAYTFGSIRVELQTGLFRNLFICIFFANLWLLELIVNIRKSQEKKHFRLHFVIGWTWLALVFVDSAHRQLDLILEGKAAKRERERRVVVFVMHTLTNTHTHIVPFQWLSSKDFFPTAKSQRSDLRRAQNENGCSKSNPSSIWSDPPPSPPPDCLILRCALAAAAAADVTPKRFTFGKCYHHLKMPFTTRASPVRLIHDNARYNWLWAIGLGCLYLSIVKQPTPLSARQVCVCVLVFWLSIKIRWLTPLIHRYLILFNILHDLFPLRSKWSRLEAISLLSRVAPLFSSTSLFTLSKSPILILDYFSFRYCSVEVHFDANLPIHWFSTFLTTHTHISVVFYILFLAKVR